MRLCSRIYYYNVS